MRSRFGGFTLIEVMVVVAILGILAAIAYPSYMNSVRKSNRTEAKTELMDVAQRLQKCFTAVGRYNDPDNKKLCPIYTDLKDGTPYVTRGQGFYEISISNDTATTYTLTATAVAGPQLGDTDCSSMTVDHMGQALPRDCW